MIKRVSGFSLLVGVGVTLGLIWSITQAEPRNAERILNLGVGILMAALVGSRAFYVVLNWGYYRSHLLDMLWVWEGGYSGSGALLGGCLGFLLMAWYAHLSPAWLADQYLPLIATLVVVGWLACWLAGCAYGEVSHAWWALPSRDEWGVSEWRVPVQFIGAVLSAVSLGWLERQRLLFHRQGMAASLALCLSALIMFGLSFLRADPMPIWYGLRMDAWGALSALAVALILAMIGLFFNRLEHT